MKMPERCPSVPVGHQTPVPVWRCTVPPRRSSSHVFRHPLPSCIVSTRHGCSQPSAPALQVVRLPEGATSDPGLRCGGVPGPPPALLYRYRQRRSPADPVAAASRHLDAVAWSPGRRDPAPQPSRRPRSSRSSALPPPPAPWTSHRHPAPTARPQPAWRGASAGRGTASLCGAAAAETPGQGKPGGGLGTKRGRRTR